MAVSEQDVEAAMSRIAPYVCKTPALDSAAGMNLYLKAESMQVTGSFKIRGAINAVLQLSSDQLRDGIVTHSSGNHGAALAHAAQTVGTRATIIMPDSAPACKINAARAAQGNVVLCAATMEARTKAAAAHMDAHPSSTLIPPYNHPHIIAGQGTIALELLQQLSCADVLRVGAPPAVTVTNGSAEAPLDAVVVPVSGGGLISGVATVLKAKLPRCKVIAAEPRGKNDMADAAACMAAGELVHLSSAPDTIADGLRAKLGDVTWPIIHQNVDAVVTVSDSEIVAAMRTLFTDAKMAVEPSGAAALAAALTPAFREAAPGCHHVAVVLSGGNVDFESARFWETWEQRASAG